MSLPHEHKEEHGQGDFSRTEPGTWALFCALAAGTLVQPCIASLDTKGGEPPMFGVHIGIYDFSMDPFTCLPAVLSHFSSCIAHWRPATRDGRWQCQTQLGLFSRKISQHENAEPATKTLLPTKGANGRHLQAYFPKLVLEGWPKHLGIGASYWLCLSTQR